MCEKWVLCPVCRGKTRLKIRENTDITTPHKQSVTDIKCMMVLSLSPAAY